MTTEQIKIVVTEQGARVVKRNIEDIGEGAKKSDAAVNLFKRSLAAIGAGVGIVELVKMVDTYTNLQNRLRLVTSGTQELTAVTKELFDISNDTRSSYESTAELFTRTSLALKGMGASTQEVLNFTKSLNQAVILSGASAVEAQAGIIQLSQGMASGALRGDELRSVLEQLPAVADVIANSLGVTRGQLRQMGTDGKITTEIIMTAFAQARNELDNNFGTTVATIGQSMVVLKNKAMEMVGSFNESTGFSRKFAEAVILLANNLNILIPPVAILGAVGLVKLAASFAGVAKAVLAFASGPLGVLIIGLTALSAYLGGPQKALLYLGAGFAKFGNSVMGIIEALEIAIKEKFSRMYNTFYSFGQDLANFVDDPFGGKGFSTSSKELEGGFVEPFKNAYDKVRVETDAFNKDIDASLYDAINKIDAENTGDLSANKPKTNKTIGEPDKEFLKTQKQVLEDILGPQREYTDTQLALNNALAEGKINQDQFNEAMAQADETFLNSKTNTNFSEGFTSQLQIMQLETRNATAQMGKDFANIFGPGGSLTRGMSDAIAQSIVYGKSFKESVQDIAKTILSTLISSLIQVGVQMVINAALGQTLTASSTATSVAAAGTTAAAWSPAAAVTSLASFGSNSVGAMIAIAAVVAAVAGLAGGFEEGGYTGGGGRSQIAGVVHGQEFVMNASATARHRGVLEAMNDGRSISSGGGGGGINVNIINQASGIEFETRQLGERDVEIIARRIVQNEAPNIVATDMSNPNSRTSKALAQNTNVTRRRS